MSPLWILVAAMAGLLNASSQRAMIFQQARPVGQPPRIQCPHCERILVRPGWRCPNCRGQVGPPRLSVELCAVAAFALLTWRIDQPFVLGAALWVASVGTPLAFVDIKERRMPDRLTLPAFAGAMALLVMARFMENEPGRIGRALMGAVGMAAVYLIVAIFGDMGYGAAKLALSLGAILGWYGRNVLVAGILAGLIIAGCYALVRASRSQGREVPPMAYSPSMLVGTLLALLLFA